MFSRPQDQQPLTPIIDILGAGLQLYVRNAAPFMAVGVFGVLAGNLFGLLREPQSDLEAALWLTFTAGIIIGLQSMTTYLMVRASRGTPPTVGRAVAALIILGPRFFVIGLTVGFVTGLLSLLNIPGLVVIVYLGVRISLVGPAVILEDQPVGRAFARSWQLIRGRWWRTFGVQLVVAMFATLLSLAVTGFSLSPNPSAAETIAISLAQGVAAPLFAAVEVLLFEDYRRASEGGPPFPLLNSGE